MKNMKELTFREEVIALKIKGWIAMNLIRGIYKRDRKSQDGNYKCTVEYLCVKLAHVKQR